MMLYTIITPANNADFFSQFKTFVVSAGWSIDAQSDSELYINNGTNYLGFRLGVIAYNTFSSNVFFTCTINDGYDNTKDYFNQPGSSLNNINSLSLPTQGTTVYQKALHALYAGSPITSAVFAADADNILVRVDVNTYFINTIIFTRVIKAHAFVGGETLWGSIALYGNSASSSGWNTNSLSSSRADAGRAFSSKVSTNNTTIYGLTLFKVDNKFVTSASNSNLFLTNTCGGEAESDYLANYVIVKLVGTFTALGTSMYTGLLPIAKPEFFYLFGDKYVYAGHINKFKLIPKNGAVDKSLLSYAGKEYLILSCTEGRLGISSTFVLTDMLAVEL